MASAVDHLAASFRTLRRHKPFSALAIVSLGVAIALNTTMYSVLDTLIDPTIAMREPDRLWLVDYFGDYRRLIPAQERNAALREGVTFHEGLTGAMPLSPFGPLLVERGSRLRDAHVLSVAPNYFTVLGVRPSAGRLLTQSDMAVDARPVVLSERMWKQLFPERDSFEPSTILLDGGSRVVVGLLPYEADFPGAYTDVWQLPLPSELDRIALNIARLKPDVSPAQAAAELSSIALRFRQRTGEDAASGYRVLSATKTPFRPSGFHYALISSVVAVLLIACANLANLQLARGVARARELATRAAVGATRRDIAIQLLMESAWLALFGLIVGAILTAWGIRIVDASVPPVISEYVTHPQISWRVLLFAVGATMFSLVLVGLLPAVRVSRVDVGEVLKSGAGTGVTRSARRQYGILVVAEVGLALSLISSAALLMRAALVVHSFRISHDKHGLVFSFVRVEQDSARPVESRRVWSDRIIRHAMGIDSVVSAATRADAMPRTHAVSAYDDAGAAVDHRAPMWSYDIVSPDYLRTMKLPIVKGRDFAPGEFAEPQVIIDEAAAAVLWQDADPVGRQLKLDSAHTASPWLRVVGVVGRARADWFGGDFDDNRSLREAIASRRRDGFFVGKVYVLNAADAAPMRPAAGRGRGRLIELAVRARGEPRHLAIALRSAIPQLGPTVTLAGYPWTWEQRTGIDRLRAKHDFIASLFTIFAALAIALAALGVYAVISHSVAQRTREFGVRMAIGASARDIRDHVRREGNILTLSGIAIGLLITAYTASLVRAFVFSDYDRYDSRIFGAAALFLFGIAWLASYLPARRAMRINPVEALHSD
jgi:putative ABC transport system permease protein